METPTSRFVAKLKSGVRRFQSLFKKNKNAVFKLFGRIILFLAKTIIETFLNDLF